MRIRLLFLPLLVVAVNPLVAETRVENGVRVHRMDSAASLAGQDSAAERSIGRVSIGLDRTFGASPSCAGMDWRRSVPQETWQARLGDQRQRSEERRVGEEWVRVGRCRWRGSAEKKNTHKIPQELI